MNADAVVTRDAVWRGDALRLDLALPELGLARSRNHAADLIREGHVSVNETRTTKSSRRIRDGERVSLYAEDHYVSRGAMKLVRALDTFDIDVRGRLALDVGASTGGFTQVLLERGASQVLAVDVGHGQMSSSLRGDSRVALVEGCNARFLTRESLASDTGVADPPSLIVADLSFISLTMVLGALAAVAAEEADFVLLIKPQFEVGREAINAGVVTDPTLRAQAIQTVLDAAAATGLTALKLTRSPIVGGRGNHEFLVHFVSGLTPDPTQWSETIRSLVRDDGAEKGTTHDR